MLICLRRESIMNKCRGCGIELSDEKKICERCFRIKHYNEYEAVNKTNADFDLILKNINKSNDLVLLLVDLFNISNLSLIKRYLKNDLILVLTKRDLLPKRTKNSKLLSYDYGIDYLDKIIISSFKNFNFDELINKIKIYKKAKNIYVVGFTNAGKSTMINKLLYNYSDNKTRITTSPIPSTTLDLIKIKLNDQITLIDTPGLIMSGDIINYVSGPDLKKIIPKKEIKPNTYQIKEKQMIVVDDYLIVEAENINLTFYVSNKLKFKKYFKEIPIPKKFKKHEIMVDKNDIVIRGLGFIRTNKKCKINIYTLDKVEVCTRDSLI